MFSSCSGYSPDQSGLVAVNSSLMNAAIVSMNLICSRSRFSPDNCFSRGSHYDLKESAWFHRTGRSITIALRNGLAYFYARLKMLGFSFPAVPLLLNTNPLEKSFQLVFKRRGVFRNKYLPFCGKAHWVFSSQEMKLNRLPNSQERELL